MNLIEVFPSIQGKTEESMFILPFGTICNWKRGYVFIQEEKKQGLRSHLHNPQETGCMTSFFLFRCHCDS